MLATVTQHRLLASLVAAIYGLVGALVPMIQAIETAPTRPWHQRTTLAARFYHIVRELLALTARIDPATLSSNPVFPTPRPPPVKKRSPRLAPSHPRPNPLPPNPAMPATLFTARQLARRLATLLHALECLAIEAAAALPARIRNHAIRARAIAGCNALPAAPITPRSWERAG